MILIVILMTKIDELASEIEKEKKGHKTFHKRERRGRTNRIVNKNQNKKMKIWSMASNAISFFCIFGGCCFGDECT